MPLLPFEEDDQTDAVAPSSIFSRSVETNLGVIKALPLFKNVPDNIITDVLKSAHVVSHNKDSILLTQGETVAQFYVVLDGWVKIFKSSAEGKEAILQILGKGEYVLEAGIASPPHCTINAQAVEQVKTLSIPAATMRLQFARSKELATNLLLLISQRSHGLLNHLEQLALRSAPQRVGWFLLKRWLETNPGGTEITLPFDKALIAAYLDIRPETFSRVMKDLQKDGFITSSQRIILPNSRALCRFCDTSTTQFCAHSDSEHCVVTKIK